MMRALMIAQAQDMSRNPMLLTFWGLVPIMSWMMTKVMPQSAEPILINILLVMAAYFVGWNLPAHTLAEEKEKRVLEAIFLTPIRPWQVVLVKGGLGILATLLMGLVVILILGLAPAHPWLLFAGYTVLTLFTVAGGTLIGLLVKDMRTLGTAGTPILLLLIFATVLPWELVQPTFWAAQTYLPTRPVVELLRTAYLGGETPVLQHLLVMLGHTALLVVLCVRQVRRLSFLR